MYFCMQLFYLKMGELDRNLLTGASPFGAVHLCGWLEEPRRQKQVLLITRKLFNYFQTCSVMSFFEFSCKDGCLVTVWATAIYFNGRRCNLRLCRRRDENVMLEFGLILI